jgi:hypothetical protein
MVPTLSRSILSTGCLTESWPPLCLKTCSGHLLAPAIRRQSSSTLCRFLHKTQYRLETGTGPEQKQLGQLNQTFYWRPLEPGQPSVNSKTKKRLRSLATSLICQKANGAWRWVCGVPAETPRVSRGVSANPKVYDAFQILYLTAPALNYPPVSSQSNIRNLCSGCQARDLPVQLGLHSGHSELRVAVRCGSPEIGRCARGVGADRAVHGAGKGERHAGKLRFLLTPKKEFSFLPFRQNRIPSFPLGKKRDPSFPPQIPLEKGEFIPLP